MSDGKAAQSRAFSHLGGHVALDLLNTIEWRLDPSQAIEDLPTYEAVLAWSRQAELLTDDERAELRSLAADHPEQARAELGRVIDLRETAYAAIVEGSAEAVERLVVRHRTGLRHARLERTGSVWTWADQSLALRTPRDRATREILALLTDAGLALLHQCEDVACGWVYLDTSRRRNRRWCAAADCGNRNRARRYYTRHRAEVQPSDPTAG